jgi:DNA-binding transcriptional regulator YdaS (Cro superfamily)
MNLPDYIREIGHPAAARLFGVSVWTIKAWRFGQRTPRPEKANEIVAITGGKLSLNDIYAKPEHT